MTSLRFLSLTGYRGTGKTTVAQLVSKRLGWGWVDSDDVIEQTAGRTIVELFANDGETVFRNLEAQVLTELCGKERTVVALGGGAVLRPANRERLAAAGPIVWLTAKAETLARRIAADGTSPHRRPNLTGLDPLEEIRRVLEERTPTYRECATLVVDTEDKSPAAVADEVFGSLKTLWPPTS